MHDAASPSPGWDLLYFCICITCTKLKYTSDAAFLKEFLSNLYAPKVLLRFFKVFSLLHSPQAFRLIFSEAEIHTSSEEHSIRSTVRSPPFAGPALASRKLHGASPSRFFPFLPLRPTEAEFGGGGREGTEADPCTPPSKISGL